MSTVNVLNLEMKSRNVISTDLLKQLRKNLNQDSIVKILRDHFPPKYRFDYDMMGFSDFSLDQALEAIEAFTGFDLIEGNLKISSDGKLQIELSGIEFRRNDDFEFCMILLALGIQVGGWAIGSWRQWTEDDGNTFKQCVFKYDIDGIIYHSSYEETEAGITEDGVDWDNVKSFEHINYLKIIEDPRWDREKFKDIIKDNIDGFINYLNYYYVGEEIIAEVFENKQKNKKTKYLAKIQGTNIEITDLFDDQEELKTAYEQSGLILLKEIKSDSYVWTVVSSSEGLDDIEFQKFDEVGKEDEDQECYDESTYPEYPGIFYFDTPAYSGKDIVFNCFPKVENVEQLFTKFNQDEINVIIKKIQKDKTIPVLRFVNENLMTGFESDVKLLEEPPFWFIPFGFYSDGTGCLLYFNKNGIYANLDLPIKLQMLVSVDEINNLEIYPGFDNSINDYNDSIKTIKIKHAGSILTFTEFFGEEYGSQLDIVYAIWLLWSKVVDYNRDSPSWNFDIPGGPKYKTFVCWDELIDWAQEEKSDEDQNNEDESELPNEIIAEVYKEGGNYYAKIKDTDNDITGLIDNIAKLKYASERSGLIRGKKNIKGEYDWRVMSQKDSQ